MNRDLPTESIFIRTILLDREINFEIMDNQGYICRLVPGELGFELSKLDKCLGNLVPAKLITAIGEHILNRDT